MHILRKAIQKMVLFCQKKIVSFFGVFFTENYNKNCLFLKIIGPGLCKIVLFFYLFSFLWGRLNFWERLSSVFGWCHLPFLVNLANWVNLHKSLCLFCQKEMVNFLPKMVIFCQKLVIFGQKWPKGVKNLYFLVDLMHF